MKQVNLSKYTQKPYYPGSTIRRFFWYITSIAFFKTSIPYPNVFKVLLLKVFGARVGRMANIKPAVNIKYPWFLELGDYVWIGEGAWIDNMAKVTIGSNVCVSQGAYILTNSHNYKKEAFDLIIAPVNIQDGAWIAAKAIICPGVTLGSHSVVTAGSVVNSDTRPYMVYRGLPAVPVRDRIIE
jgi:putative colanic acid biosynthesis acetyltransferase WcaF